MKKIVDMILKEEKEARMKTEKAKRDAEAIVARAKKESLNLIQAAIEEGSNMASQKNEESQKAFIAEKNKILQEAKEKHREFIKTREKNIPSMVKKVFGRAMGF